jgi:hypothetical protein
MTLPPFWKLLNISTVRKDGVDGLVPSVPPGSGRGKDFASAEVSARAGIWVKIARFSRDVFR